jgi:Kef-type K+ transport system membrane component KefB
VLTFLAGAEVDPGVLRDKLKESRVIGGLSFLLPFAGGLLVARYVLGWDWRAAEIGGIALSTTSLAVVYAVLVETGLNQTEIGKTIMAATFVTDFGTAAALSVLLLTPNLWMIPFVLVSVVVLTAVVPTAIAQRFFTPAVPNAALEWGDSRRLPARRVARRIWTRSGRPVRRSRCSASWAARSAKRSLPSKPRR